MVEKHSGSHATGRDCEQEDNEVAGPAQHSLSTSANRPLPTVPTPRADQPSSSAPSSATPQPPPPTGNPALETFVIAEDDETGLTVVVTPPALRQTEDAESDEEPSTKYKTRITYVDPQELVILDVIRRHFRDHHGEDLRTRMVTMGYSTEFGFISWTWNASLGMKLCINGEHRLGAVAKQEKLVAEGKANMSTLEQFKKVEMLEYYDESGADIPLSDVVIPSANANEKTSCVAPPSTADKMGTIISYLTLNPYLESMSITAATNKVIKKGVLSGLSVRSIRRYVTIGTVLKRNIRAEKLFRRYCLLDQSPKAAAPGGMSLSVLCNSNFTAASEATQVLSLVCVHPHYTACKESGRAASSPSLTEASCGNFFKVVGLIANAVQAVAARREMSIYDVYDFVVSHDSAGATIQASAFIANYMTAWRPMDDATEAIWVRGLERDVIERLLTALPQKVDHIVHEPDEEVAELDADGAEEQNEVTDEPADPSVSGDADETAKASPGVQCGTTPAQGSKSVAEALADVYEETLDEGEAVDTTPGSGKDNVPQTTTGEGAQPDPSPLASGAKERGVEAVHSNEAVVNVGSAACNAEARTGGQVSSALLPRAVGRSDNLPQNSPPKKRLRDTQTGSEDQPPPKRVTRAQTASQRLVQSIDEGELPSRTQPTAALPQPATKRGVARKKKSRTTRRKTKAQLEKEKKNREHAKFDDKVGPLPDGVTAKSEMYHQLVEKQCVDYCMTIRQGCSLCGRITLL